jgi:hypothetical protein
MDNVQKYELYLFYSTNRAELLKMEIHQGKILAFWKHEALRKYIEGAVTPMRVSLCGTNVQLLDIVPEREMNLQTVWMSVCG